MLGKKSTRVITCLQKSVLVFRRNQNREKIFICLSSAVDRIFFDELHDIVLVLDSNHKQTDLLNKLFADDRIKHWTSGSNDCTTD